MLCPAFVLHSDWKRVDCPCECNIVVVKHVVCNKEKIQALMSREGRPGGFKLEH